MGGVTVSTGGVEPERNRERAPAHFKRDWPACSSSNRRVIGELPVTHSGEFSHSIFRLVECDCSLIYLALVPEPVNFLGRFERAAQTKWHRISYNAESTPSLERKHRRLVSIRVQSRSDASSVLLTQLARGSRPKADFEVRHWDASHEDGQALRAHLAPPDSIAENIA